MNLNDLYEGREPYQQAIDKLEQRRIEDLEAKMDNLARRAKESQDPKVVTALRHEFAKAKAERDSYHKVNEAPGAETLSHNQNTVSDNEAALDLEENNTDRLRVSPHDKGAFAALKGKPYESNPYPKGSQEHLLWSKGHNSMRAHKADLEEHGGGGGGPAQWHAYVRSHRTNEDEIDEHGGGVNSLKNYISWRKSANKERGITSKQPVGKPSSGGVPAHIPKGSVHSKLDTSKGVVPTAKFSEADANDVNFGHTVSKGSWIVHQDGKKPMRFKTHSGAKKYAEANGGKVYSSEFYADKFQSRDVAEGMTDYQKRRQRERDIDMGKPVSRAPKNPQTDYAKKRAKEKRELDLGEELKDPKDNPCWKGYHPVGTKEKGGRTVPNCVPTNEDEGDCEGLPHLTPELASHIADQINTEGPHAIVKSVEWGDGASEELVALIQQELENYSKGTINEDWNKVNKKDKTDGMSQKAVNAYRREHPGSKLKTAVTKKPSKIKKGSKDDKRRKSFCARMSGNKGPMKDEHGKPTPKAKALKRWNCEESIAEGWQDFNKVEPYAVCLAGKPVKKFDYYEEARRFHDNWKKKLYNQGEKEKADKITLMPILDEEGWSINPEHLKGPRSMKAAAKKPTGPKFSGYLKGTDPAPNEYTNKGMGGCEESIENEGAKVDRMAKHIEKSERKLGHSKKDAESIAWATLNKRGYLDNKNKKEHTEEGIEGNMTARSMPLMQPLKQRNPVAKNAIQSGAGKHANNLKKAVAQGRKMKHKAQAIPFDESAKPNFLTWVMEQAEFAGFDKNPEIYAAAKKVFNESIIRPALLSALNLTPKEALQFTDQDLQYYAKQKIKNGNGNTPFAEAVKKRDDLEHGEYYIWTVYFDDGNNKRVKVTSDQFDAKAYYAKKNKVVVNVDYDWTIHNERT